MGGMGNQEGGKLRIYLETEVWNRGEGEKSKALCGGGWQVFVWYGDGADQVRTSIGDRYLSRHEFSLVTANHLYSTSTGFCMLHPRATRRYKGRPEQLHINSLNRPQILPRMCLKGPSSSSR